MGILANMGNFIYSEFMSTDARQIARDYYNLSTRSLAQDLTSLSINSQGVVIFTPALVALLKPMAIEEQDLWQELAYSPHCSADAWYVHLLVGDLQLARLWARELPPLPWLCFQRGRRSQCLHRLSWPRFLAGALAQH